MNEAPRDIGLNVTPPEATCSDQHCPFHGTLSVRGQIISGTVVSNKMNGSVVIEKTYKTLMSKYHRYMTKSSRFLAHLPGCITKQRGDPVVIGECRPLSKNIAFVVIE